MNIDDMELSLIKPICKAAAECKTKQGAAKRLYAGLQDYCEAVGMPRSEVFIQTPEESAQGGYGKCWRVCFEAGPYEWGISASLDWLFNRGAGWYTEPYYSFDVCFTE